MHKSNKKGLIGYISLPDGDKAIQTMTALFVNFTYKNPENWEDLKTMTNIFYEDYRCKAKELHAKDASVKLIEGKVKVTTEYEHYTNRMDKPKAQDLRTESETSIDYTEMQLKTSGLRIPIEKRSINYLGLSLTRDKDNKLIQQLWLLGDDLQNKSILRGKEYANFNMLDEVDYAPHGHENSFGLMYVNLKKLGKANTKAGELANVLLDKEKNPKHKAVTQIYNTLQESFDKFREDKEVKNVINAWVEQEYEVMQRGMKLGRLEGKREGIAEALRKSIAVMLKYNLPVEGIAKELDVTTETVEAVRSNMEHEEK